MRFERGLRRAGLRPSPVGYMATPTDDGNREKALCQWGGIPDSGVWVTEKSFPVGIELSVRFIPVWMDNPMAFVQLGDYTPCSLYYPRSVFSCVKVEAVGGGFYQPGSRGEKISFTGEWFPGYRLVTPTPILYQKNFPGQPEGCRIHRNVTDMGIDGIPYLWAYGAQQIGDDLHPFVFTLDEEGGETVVRPSPFAFWKEQGITPFGERRAVFQEDFTQDQTRTLFQSLEAGQSVIHLEVGIDEQGVALRIPYYSYRVSRNIIFYRREA